MRLLLDTHVLLWWVDGDARLAPGVAAVMTDPANEVFGSAVSAAEIAIRSSLGKLSTAPVAEVMSGDGFRELPFAARHAIALAGLPLLHRDPFDRMLIAQALVEGLVLLTLDRNCRAYDVPVFPFR